MEERFKHDFPHGIKYPIEDKKLVVNAYVSAMQQDGIYGTGTEVEALSDALQCPIHVYYRDVVTHDPDVPSRIYGKEFAAGAPPICVVFFMGRQHYNLLFPRKPHDYCVKHGFGKQASSAPAPSSSAATTAAAPIATAPASVPPSSVSTVHLQPVEKKEMKS